MKTVAFLIVAFFTLGDLTIEKDEFYDILSGESVQNINKLITDLEQQKSTSINDAYKGALISKKANFEKSAAKKIKTFKIGVELLETEIKKNPKQTEYRFLRLCIQENCPKILKYNKNITEDVQLITSNFKNQSKQLKTIIANYAKSSKALDISLLK